MLRQFFRDSSIYAIAGVLSQGIAFILFPFFAHVFHPRDYGAIDILGLIGVIVSLTVALEISQGLGRRVGETPDEHERSEYASTALLFTLGCFGLFAVVTLALAGPLSTAVLGPGFGPGLWRLAVVTWCVNGALYLTQDQLRWRLRPRAFAAVAITVAATTTAASAVYVLGLHAGVSGAIGGQLTGAVCGLALAGLFSRHAYALRFDWARCRQMLRYSLPLIPASVGVFFNGYADRLALQHEGSLAQVGVYGIAYRFAVILGLVLVGFQGSTLPLVISRHHDPETRVTFAQLFQLFCALALGATLAMSVFADTTVRVLAAPAYAGAAVVVPPVALATLLGGMYTFAPGPTIRERTRPIAAAFVSAGALNAILAFALVPSWGIDGAAAATLLSSMLAFAVMMLVSQRLYHVPHDWKKLAAATAITVGLVVISRTLVPTGRASAFEPVVILARCVITAVGVAGLVGLLVDRPHQRAAWQIVRRRSRLIAAGAPSGERA